MKTSLSRLGASLGLLLWWAGSLPAAWQLQPLQINGGGWVTGMVIHPTDPAAIYNRTDVGGANRFDRVSGQWRSISDWTPPEVGQGYHGVDALCLDPAAAYSHYVWMALGRGVDSSSLWRSSDYGESWTKMNLPAGILIDGNGKTVYEYRITGPRLACDPFGSGQMLLGTREDGLWRSADRGMNWTAVAVPTGSTSFVVWVHYDRFIENRALIAVEGGGVYYTDNMDAATPTWTRVVTGGTPRRVSQGPDGTIFCTFRPGVVNDDQTPNTGVLYRLTTDPGTGAVTTANLTIPNAGAYHKGMLAIATHPTDPHFLIGAVCGPTATTVGGVTVRDTILLRSTNALAAAPVFEVLYRNDSGSGSGYTVDPSGVPAWLHPEEVMAQYLTHFAFDPHLGTNVVWAVEAGGGIDQTMDITAAITTWTNHLKGMEETVSAVIASNPNGNVISGMADLGGFFHNQGLDAAPSVSVFNAGTGRSGLADIDYSGGHPNRMVYVGRYTINPAEWHIGGYSDDGGASWTRWSEASFPFPSGTNPVMVAVSADNPDNIVISGSLGIYSANNGATWSVCTGLPDGEQGNFYSYNRTLAADKVSPGTFYKYDASEAKLYRSSNGGATWSAVSSGLPIGKPWDGAWPGMLRTAPNVAGHLWLTPGADGSNEGQPPYFSTDGGTTWNAVAGFSRAKAIATGMGSSPSNYAVYILGTYNGVWGLWASTDVGQSFTNIMPSGRTLGNAVTIQGDKSTPGRVLIGTGGSGMRYLEDSLAAPVITSLLTATGQVGVAFSYPITATNNPVSFGASNLPAGLAVNTGSGLINGTPTIAGYYGVGLTATNAVGSGNATLLLEIDPADLVPSITTMTLPGGTVGVAYNQTLAAAGGNTPLSWSLDNGALPAGLGLSAAGVISGTPASAGTANFTVRVTDTDNDTDTQALSITVLSDGGGGGTWNLSSVEDADVRSTAPNTVYNGTRVEVQADTKRGFYKWDLSTVSGNLVSATLSLDQTYLSATAVLRAHLVTDDSWSQTALTWNNQPPVSGTYVEFTVSGTNDPVVDVTSLLAADTGTSCTIALLGQSGGLVKFMPSTNLAIVTSGTSAPVITSPTSAAGEQGVAFSYQITATNDPDSYGATGLPAGLSVNTGTGLISGTPTVNGNFTVALSATNAGGTGPADLSLVIAAPDLFPTITTTTLPDGTVGVAYSQALAAASGDAPLSWSLDSGTLPAGLSLSTAGIISGTPASAGTASFTVRVTDADGDADTQALSITVLPGGGGQIHRLEAEAASYVNGTLTAHASASGGQFVDGKGGFILTWSFTASMAGTHALQFAVASPSGTRVMGAYVDNSFIGTITTSAARYNWEEVVLSVDLSPGSHSIELRDDQAALEPDVDYLEVVEPVTPAPVINSAASAGGELGVPFSYQITATHNPTSYGATGLPTGLSVNTETGLISGIPTVTGLFWAVISATNAGGTGSENLEIIITVPDLFPAITTTTLPEGTVGVAFNQTLAATSGDAPLSWILDSGALPAGLSLSAAGVLSGTPTTDQTANFTVRVTDADGDFDTAALSITVLSGGTSGGTWNLSSVEDADVRSTAPDTVYNASRVEVQADTKRGFYKWDISAASGNLVSATLSLDQTYLSATAVLRAYLVTDDSWSQTSLTWNNQPAVSATYVEFTVTAGVDPVVDLTSLLDADTGTSFTIALLGQSGGHVKFMPAADLTVVTD